MTFKSEISYKFLAVITLFILVVCAFSVIGNESKSEIFIVTGVQIFTLFFIWYIFHSINYTIESNKILKLTCGFVYRKQIPIVSIKSITKTKSLLSSPAASLTKRIELKFGKFDSIIISPKNREGFVKAIQKINPEVEVKL
ncbi:PH domain-containing protein [Seonamhaeicola sp. MEBiC1930]|uniref:PH domain-containing protein n=1 Tax=Seonamhaeicola sp. MEBiC01930 TaxID=2976768 RepID=UPI003248F744